MRGTTQTVKDWNNKRKKDKVTESTKKDDTPEDSPSDGKGKNLLDKSKSKVTGIIENAIQKTNQVCEKYKNKHKDLEIELEKINDEIDEQTKDLEKTKYEIKRLNHLKDTNNELIEKAKTELEKEETNKLASELRLQVLRNEITLEEAKLLQKNKERADAAQDLIDLENQKTITQQENENQQMTEKRKQKMKAIEDQITSKRTVIKTLDDEITTIDTKLINLYKEKSEKIAELRERALNIQRINTYMNSLKTIQQEYIDTMKKHYDSQERIDGLEKSLKVKSAHYEAKLKRTKEKMKELQDKEQFYSFLKLKLDEANMLHNRKSPNSDVNVGEAVSKVADAGSRG